MTKATPAPAPTLDYAGRPPNLPRPIDHPGMHPAPHGPSMLLLTAQALGGFLLAVWFVLMLGWLAALLFPNTS